MKKLIILLMGLFLFSNLVYALDCQYKTNETHSELVNFSTVDGIEYGKPFIEIKYFQQSYWEGDRYMGRGMSGSFQIHNNYDLPITVSINYFAGVDGNNDKKSEVITVTPLGSDSITWDLPIKVREDSIKFEILEPKNIKQGSEYVIISKEICKQCNNNECKNDGGSCSLSNECGGGYCVRGVCSDSDVCFNTDCNCTSDEIQCNDNKRCVEKYSVSIGVKPECNKPQECVTGYIEQKTELCAKSPTQIEEEAEKEKQRIQEEAEKEKWKVVVTGISVLLLLVIGWFIYSYYKKKLDIERLKAETDKIKIEIEKINTEYKKRHDEIEQENKEIEEINLKSNKTKEEYNQLKNLQKKLQEKLQEQSKQINEFEKIKAEHKKRQAEIDQQNKKIEKIKLKSHITTEECDKLKNLQKKLQDQINELKKIRDSFLKNEKNERELKEQITEFEKNSKDFLLKKYTERYENKIYVDSAGYIRFKDSNILLHRFIYESAYGNVSRNNEVHHIDANHYNDEIWNLVELTAEKHHEIKHGRINYCDWTSGIQELKRIGLSNKDFHPEIIKRLRNQ